MEKGTIYKFLAMLLLLLSIAILLYELFPLIRGEITESQILNGVKIPGVLFICHLLLKVMIPGEYPYLADIFQQLNGMPIILLALSLVVLLVYLKSDNNTYYDLFKFIFGSFIGSFIQKNTSKNQLGEK